MGKLRSQMLNYIFDIFVTFSAGKVSGHPRPSRYTCPVCLLSVNVRVTLAIQSGPHELICDKLKHLLSNTEKTVSIYTHLLSIHIYA